MDQLQAFTTISTLAKLLRVRGIQQVFLGISKFLALASLLFTISSCSMVSYVWDQSSGYLGLRWNSKENSELLKDENFPDKYKKKIILIEQYKKWFFEFFKKEHSDIYSKTTILENHAVTYLVIASKYNEIKPKEFSFWFVGKFPYIGFFDKEKADRFEKDLQQEDYVTYQRPVYAFSTLNKFEDPILSSFFYYSDFNLAGLIFHELFHTIFFIKDDVELNENLAQFFSRELLKHYFKNDSEKLRKGELDEKYSLRLRSYLKEAAQSLKSKYQEMNKKSNTPGKEEYLKLKREFVSNTLIPKLEGLCDDYQIQRQRCRTLQGDWNNARLAAFLSYERDVDFFSMHFKKSKMNLLEYFKYLNQKHENFEDEDLEISFVEYLKSNTTKSE